MFLACSRLIFLLVFLAGALTLGASLFLEYGVGLEPCLLCQVQRCFLLGLCLVNLMGYVHGPRRAGMRCYSIASMLFALGGAASALRQVLMQRLAPEQLMFCQPDLARIWRDLSLNEIVSMIYRGNDVCAQISWTVFDLSIPELSLLAFVGLSITGGFQVVSSIYYRKPRTPATRSSSKY